MNAEMFEEWFGLAKALDRVGDRWTLLIVHELLLGRRRFRELRGNLPGIGANELANRLFEMESNGLIACRPLDGESVYQLTEGGRELEVAVLALIRWGGRSLPSSPPRAEFRPERLALALKAAQVAEGDDPSLELRVAAGGMVVRVAIADGETIAEVETANDVVGLVVSGDPRLLVALAAGYMSIEQVEERGIVVHAAKNERGPLERVVA
jgi:DNA-binding HxlR family transcriptional regulator